MRGKGMIMELISRNITKKYDVVVVGGGMSGVCAAIAAARHKASVALVQNRPMLGGNASSEIRMHICGANCQISKKDVNETGILLELLLANKRVNPRFNYNLWDAVLIEKVKSTPGLDLYLNTVMHKVITEGNKIKAVVCYRQTTEQTFTFEAPYFIDSTGHGTLGFFAGADWRGGSEGREEFSEKLAPEKPTDALMGNTLLFKAVNLGYPVKFIKPDFAYTFTEEHLFSRPWGANDAFNIYITEASSTQAMKVQAEREEAFSSGKRLRTDEMEIKFHIIKPYEPFDIMNYRVTAVKAHHAAGIESVNFVIEDKKEGKLLFWGHDTGLLTKEVKGYLAENFAGRTFDFVSLDCTLERGNCITAGHMDLDRCIETLDWMKEKGLCGEKTKAIISHIGHLVKKTHAELEAEAKECGIITAYDGMKFEF